MDIRFIILFFCCWVSSLSLTAQDFAYEEEVELGNGLYKVKSGDSYGLIDNKGNVVVSVEYQDLKFRQGKALLTKSDVLMGIVDSLGNIKRMDGQYKVHPIYRYIYDGFILVTHNESSKLRNKWGYINENGTPFRFPKVRGTVKTSKKYPTMFDDVKPFVEGCAAVYLKDEGWKHYDLSGRERFILRNKDRALLRSSLYKGECIIVTKDGIKQYQENNGLQAVVKRELAASAVLLNSSDKMDKYSYEEGELTLDSLMRVVKFKNNEDEIYFINEYQRKVKVMTEPVKEDTLSIKNNNLGINLSSSYLRANSRGVANARIKITNTTNNTYENLSVSIECLKISRDFNIELAPLSGVTLSLNGIPARFSAASIKRHINVKISYKNECVEKDLPVTILRYKPVR